ncbi:MAG: glucose 1-dehydrogenase [Chloroflexi bacterium]|nr:glucose 1-dehydrogenase [Chloroflexota bacterium]
MPRLDGKVAIVTGAARGMGEVEARLFAEEGATVVVCDVSDVAGQRVAGDIVAHEGSAEYLHLNATDEDNWSEVIGEMVRRHGKLDILVNNAGISGYDEENNLGTSTWDRLLEINAKGVFLGMKHAIGAMEQADGGSIVNISAISGIVGQDFIHMGYNASKGAARLMTKSPAIRWAEGGIRVNSVHPGLMPPMAGGSASSETRDAMTANIPMKRTGRREEVAYAVLFLASDEASYITGGELVADGGFTAQ